MATRPSIAGLYAIADTDCIAPSRLIETVELAIVGGAKLVQYRDKTNDHAMRGRQANALVRLCEKHRVLLIINDDPELAVHVGAAGVHLGHDDPALKAARRKLGPQAIIGVSCYNELELAITATAQGADYVAFGSFYPSPTKPGAARASCDLLRSAKQQLYIPLVAIGGITPENGGVLIAAGADALAVIQGVFAQPDVRQAARRYAALFASEQ